MKDKHKIAAKAAQQLWPYPANVRPRAKPHNKRIILSAIEEAYEQGRRDQYQNPLGFEARATARERKQGHKPVPWHPSHGQFQERTPQQEQEDAAKADLAMRRLDERKKK